ncbi:MAG: hypothetical protein ACLPZF_26555 [Candidatus Acidiferrales bacterium]
MKPPPQRSDPGVRVDESSPWAIDDRKQKEQGFREPTPKAYK